MNLWRSKPNDGAAVPMPQWQRWLCALVLLVTAPLWLLAMMVIAIGLILWAIGRELLED